MTDPKHTEPRVTQADREAALALRIYTTSLSENDYRAVEARETFLTGKRDHWEIVQAFARHRTAAEAASRSREERLAAALESIARKAKQMADARQDQGGLWQGCADEARAALSPADGGEA